MRDRLIRQLFQGTAPLLLWALHFTVCYGLVALQCSPAAVARSLPQRPLLAVFSALALGACLALLWRARRILREASEQTRLLDWSRACSALLALAGIAWTSVPLSMLEGC